MNRATAHVAKGTKVELLDVISIGLPLGVCYPVFVLFGSGFVFGFCECKI